MRNQAADLRRTGFFSISLPGLRGLCLGRVISWPSLPRTILALALKGHIPGDLLVWGKLGQLVTLSQGDLEVGDITDV